MDRVSSEAKDTLDIRALCEGLLPGHRINRIRYFTAKVSARPFDPAQPARQEAYLRAIQTLPGVRFHLGHDLLHAVRMPLAVPPPSGSPMVRVLKSEEKASAVNIAASLLLDAFKADSEQAVILSNDSDLKTPIELVRHDGARLDNAGLRGHWTLVFFGFTHCPDVCPTALAMLAQVRRDLANLPDGRVPEVLFVSVDPERDDAARLAAYVTFFDPTFVGATGSASQVAAAAAAFSVPYARVPLADGGYTMDHGAGIFVVDPAGALAALSSSARDAAALARDYRKLIAWREDDR